MSFLIEAKQDDPIVDRTGPFAVRQKGLGVCSQRTEQSRNVLVTPTDQNHFSLLVCTQVSRQVSGLIVAKTRIDFQFCCLCKRFQCQTRPVAFL